MDRISVYALTLVGARTAFAKSKPLKHIRMKMTKMASLRFEVMVFRFIYTGIRVRNMDGSIRFYTEVLGIETAEKRERTEPTKGEVVTLKSPNSTQLLELNFYENDSPFYVPYVNGEDLDHLAFDVKNLESVVSDLKSKGVKIVVEPYQIGGWREAFIEDPNGI